MAHSQPLICILDHQADTLASLAYLVNTLDVEVKVFSDAYEFLNQIDQLEVGCLILEMNLPHLNGLKLVKQLHQLHHHIPTIMLSSGSELSDAVEAMREGCVDFIEKPFVERQLIDRVERILAA